MLFFGGETDKEEISSPVVAKHVEEFPATEVEIPAEFLDEITQGKSILTTEKGSVLCFVWINPTFPVFSDPSLNSYFPRLWGCS